jgi:hypothetical protein
MNKNSVIFGAIGVIIIVVVIFFVQKKPAQAPSQNRNNNSTAVNPPPPPPVNQPVEIIVDYKKDQPFTAKSTTVTEGQQVIIKVISDIADELHLHGYDLHTDLEAGKEGSIIFTADKTGRFEFELEDHKITLGVIEVYPK